MTTVGVKDLSRKRDVCHMRDSAITCRKEVCMEAVCDWAAKRARRGFRGDVLKTLNLKSTESKKGKLSLEVGPFGFFTLSFH